MARDLKQNISDRRDIVIQLLFTDLDLAWTFLETARVSNRPERKSRNVANAVSAYNQISTKVADLNIPAATREELNAGLLALEQRISEFGVDI